MLAHLAGADSSCGAQAVPAVQDWSASAAAAPAAFEWSDASGVLFAAGGAAPAAIHCWDLAQERCLAQAPPAAARRSPSLAVQTAEKELQATGATLVHLRGRGRQQR